MAKKKSFGERLGERLIAGQLQPGLESLSEHVKQLANAVNPIALPGPGELLEAYNRSCLGRNMLGWALRLQGVLWPGDRFGLAGPAHRDCWEAVRRAGLSLPDPSDWFAYSLSQINGDKLWDAYLKRSGANTAWWSRVKDYLYERPGIAEVTDLWRRKIIDIGEYDTMLRFNGTTPELWRRSVEALSRFPEVETANLAFYRGTIGQGEWEKWLDRNSYADPNVRAALQELRQIIPPVSDLLHFDQKDVFVGPLASALHLYDEFPENAVPWAAKQGLVGGPAFPITVDGQQVPADWLHLYWGARWDAPAFGQIAEFYQRFGAHRKRPRIPDGLNVLRLSVGPGPGGLPGVPGAAPGRGAAAGQDVRTWLRYANIPPVIRDTFLAAAFRPLGMRQVSQAVRLGTIRRADAVESYQDQGYSPDDAERMADLAVEQDRYAKDAPRRSLVQRLIGQSLHEIVASYETGVISRSLAAERLFGVLQQQEAVEIQLGLVDNRILRGLADRALKSIRTDWMQGTLSPAELQAALIEAGIQPERVTYYVQLWTLERGHRRRAASSGQILSWVAKGLMPAEEASRRLANLNWYGPDAAVLLADSQHKLAKLQAAEEARVSSTASKSAKAVAKMHKETAALQKSLQSRLRASEPVSRLLKWFKAGIIDEPQLRKRMQAIGVVPSVIEQYVKEVHAEMGTERHKAEEAATTKSRKGVRHAPVSTLRKWLKLGIINADQFRSMAAAVKTDKDDIERYVQQTEMGK